MQYYYFKFYRVIFFILTLQKLDLTLNLPYLIEATLVTIIEIIFLFYKLSQLLSLKIKNFIYEIFINNHGKFCVHNVNNHHTK